MSEMVERVARAIRGADMAHAQVDNWPVWEDVTSPHKAIYLERARAAIEAMREPTAAILNELAAPWTDEDQAAGKALMRLRGTGVVFPKVENEMAVGQWQRAIDAALAPPSEE